METNMESPKKFKIKLSRNLRIVLFEYSRLSMVPQPQVENIQKKFQYILEGQTCICHVLATIYITFIFYLQLLTQHSYCLRYYKLSRDDLKYMSRCVQVMCNCIILFKRFEHFRFWCPQEILGSIPHGYQRKTVHLKKMKLLFLGDCCTLRFIVALLQQDMEKNMYPLTDEQIKKTWYACMSHRVKYHSAMKARNPPICSYIYGP